MVAGDFARSQRQVFAPFAPVGDPPNYLSLFWWTLVWRAARIMDVGAVVAGLGVLLRRVLVRWYSAAWWTGFPMFAVLLHSTFESWK